MSRAVVFHHWHQLKRGRRPPRQSVVGLAVACAVGLAWSASSVAAVGSHTPPPLQRGLPSPSYADVLGPLLGSGSGADGQTKGESASGLAGAQPAVAPESAAEPDSDPNNRLLIQNVRGPGREMPKALEMYDLVVLGAGVAGLISCIVARQLGRSVAMVERHYTGGDCLNTGCVPSKALIAAARQAALVRESAAYGISTQEVQVDFAAVMARMRQIRAEISEHDSVQRYTDQVGVDVFTGEASFSGSHEVQINNGGPTLRFRKCMIATGASPRVPDELRGIEHLTSANLWNLTSLPPRLLVLGSGPIGLELAQAMQRLGSRVTVICRSERLLGKEEAAAGQLVSQALKRDGVDFLVGGKLEQVTRGKGSLFCEPFGPYTVRVRTTPAAVDELKVDAILNATGRFPNTRDLNLDRAGVEGGENGSVWVNSRLQSSNPDIFAAGDCLSGPNQFTHAAEWEARVAVRNAFLGEDMNAQRLLVPRATYTDPEVAAVGHTSEELLQANIPFETFTRDAKDVDRNRCDGIDVGFASLHVAPDGQILGATVVAPHAGDYISEVTLCMQHGLTAADLAGTMHPYPTGAEIVRQAAQAFVRSRIYGQESQALLASLSQPSQHLNLLRTEGGLLSLELNRPEVLNACDLAMVHGICEALGDSGLQGLLLRGAGEGFCAGGDVKALAMALQGSADSPVPRLQISYEYRSIKALQNLAGQVPVTAIADGICMGYGLGLFAVCRHRVVVEKSCLAMPECVIGIVPDAGFTAVAAALPPGVGLCMALTGWRLCGPHAVITGLANHFAREEDLPALVEELIAADAGRGNSDKEVGAIFDRYACPIPSACRQELEVLNNYAEEVFASATSVQQVKERLEAAVKAPEDADRRQWALERLEGLERGCPLAQMVSFRLVREAEHDLRTLGGHENEHLRLARALEREHAAMSNLLYRPDFLEGVRALLIDKDGRPEWQCGLQELSVSCAEAVLQPGAH